MKKPNILVVDDEKVILQLFERSFAKDEYNVDVSESGHDALEKAKKTSYNLIITDIKMPGVSGVDVLREVKKENPYTEVIMITGHPTIDLAVEAIKIGATDFICKPFDLKKVHIVIDKSLNRQKFALNYLEVNELRKLLEISKSITLATSIESLLEQILDVALVITGAQQGWVLLRDEQTKTLNVTTKRELNQVALEDMQKKLTAPSVKENGCEEKSDVLTDFSKNASACISLVSSGIPIGGINITGRSSGEPFTMREQAFLSILASQTALAVENLKLTRKIAESRNNS